MSADQNAALEIHNKARAELSIAPLAWDQNLANDAKEYAKQLASRDSGMQHSTELQVKKQGENLAMYSMKWSKPFAAASKCWLSEKKDWKGGVIRMSDFYAVGHYTQMIWSTTTHVGIGVAFARSGATYVVARYSPQGNQVGQSPHPGTDGSSLAGNELEQQQQHHGSAAGGSSLSGNWLGQQQQQDVPAPVNANASGLPVDASSRKQRRARRSGNKWISSPCYTQSSLSMYPRSRYATMGFSGLPTQPGAMDAAQGPWADPNAPWRPQRPGQYTSCSCGCGNGCDESSRRNEIRVGCCTIL